MVSVALPKTAQIGVIQMSKVIYNDKECEVISVETEWEWGYYEGNRVRKPGDTWILINYKGHLIWVSVLNCKGCSNV